MTSQPKSKNSGNDGFKVSEKRNSVMSTLKFVDLNGKEYAVSELNMMSPHVVNEILLVSLLVELSRIGEQGKALEALGKKILDT